MMIPQLVAALRAGRPFAMTAGTQTRDFVFVDDVAEAIVAAVAAAAGVTINIGSGEELAVRDAAHTIARAVGADESLLRFGELPTRPGEALRYVLDVARAQRLLGWAPRTPLAVGATRL
jgi:nucleoside-diphosphate-sugar epimerase